MFGKRKQLFLLYVSLMVTSLISGKSSADVIAAVKERTVMISVKSVDRDVLASVGTGYILDSTGIVVTAAHVVKGAELVYGSVGGPNGVQYELSIIKEGVFSANDYSQDVALLQLGGDVTPRLDRGFCVVDPKENPGYVIQGIGFPWGSRFTVAPGTIGDVSEEFGGVFQTTGNFGKGMSGGPVLNQFGQLVGLIVSGKDNDGSLAYVLPVKNVIEFVYGARDDRPEPACLDECEKLGTTVTDTCQAHDKCKLHCAPVAHCTLNLAAPEGQYFNQTTVTVVHESYRNIQGVSAVNAMQAIKREGLIRQFTGTIGCTNAQGTGRTCESQATVAATHFPEKCAPVLQ